MARTEKKSLWIEYKTKVVKLDPVGSGTVLTVFE